MSLLWGPYLSERQWGTVREDLSADGNWFVTSLYHLLTFLTNCRLSFSWDHFTHSQSVYRAYLSGEDGLFGFCDDQARLCFSVALWNGQDPILKERLFGMSGPEVRKARYSNPLQCDQVRLCRAITEKT